jgi:hypothetical protein
MAVYRRFIQHDLNYFSLNTFFGFNVKIMPINFQNFYEKYFLNLSVWNTPCDLVNNLKTFLNLLIF